MVHWYKRDPDAALAGMAELTMKERGVYNSILDLLYARDGLVPDDDARVARMISAHWREYKAIKLRLVAKGKVWSENGFLCAKRVQEALKEASDFSQDQSKRASKGWQKRKSYSYINGASMPPGNASTTTTTSTISGIRDLGSKEGFKALPASNEFVAWKAYAFEKNVPLWRELQRREQEGRGFDFDTQWPPEKAHADTRSETAPASG